MTHPLVEARHRERWALIDRARSWAGDLGRRLPGLVAVVVVGSVARGDFNAWSDLDVVVVADALPDGFLERWDLVSPLPPRVQPIVWTTADLARARRKRNPLAVEADGAGVVVWGALPPQDGSDVR